MYAIRKQTLARRSAFWGIAQRILWRKGYPPLCHGTSEMQNRGGRICLATRLMSNPQSLIGALGALLASLPERRKRQLLLLVGLMFAGAVAEAVSLGAVVPFLAILSDPAQALQKPLVADVVNILGLTESDDLRWQLTLLFSIAAVTSGVVRFVLVYATARFNFGIGHELGAEIYHRALHQPYEVHVARNSSEIIGGLNKLENVVTLFFNLLNTCSAVLMAVFIISALVLIDPRIATTALLGFGSFYAVVSLVTRKRLTSNSRAISRGYNARVQTMQEGMGGIRDVLLDHTQALFAHRFNQIDWSMRQAQASNNIIGPSPRFVVEALSMVFIALLGYHMTASGDSLSSAIPTLGALTLGAQRLMPLLQQGYQGWAYVAGNRLVLFDVVDLLQQPVLCEIETQLEPLPFQHEIKLEKVSFSYQAHLPAVLNEMTLTIPRGSRVGFLGVTGSGKSTAMDLIMGLLQPSQGKIMVDGILLIGSARRAWQRNIAHVPQSIFLLDASFAENIAFGVPGERIEMPRVREAARQAQIADFIEADPQSYSAMLGERGVRLSGGQRQRVGIARALYKQAKVLVFDEATSALDNETEAAVISSIQSLGRDLTILMIAHRLSTLAECDLIVEISKGCITSIKNKMEKKVLS